MDKAFFYESVDKWIHSLYVCVSDISKQNKDVVLVAISRKMPRLIQSLMTEDAKLNNHSKNLLREILAKTDYVTEHALPFIFTNREKNSYETVIIDDTAVFGNTLRQIVEDVYFFTGKKPLAFPIFISSKASFGDYIQSGLLEYSTKLPLESIQKFHRWVDNLVKSMALPIDVEFPILRLALNDESSANVAYDSICYKLGDISNPHIAECYTISDSKSFCILLKKDLAGDAVKSFTKVRIFQLRKQISLAIFSPQSFSDHHLLRKNLFKTRDYDEVWNFLLSNMDSAHLELSWSRMRERVARSLVVWANYLFSLSRLNYLFIKENFSVCNLKISFDDVRLLVGKSIALSLMKKLNDILDNRRVTVPLTDREKLQDKIVPNSLSNVYDSIRVSYCLDNLSMPIDSTLDKLFHIMDYSNGIIGKSYSRADYSRSGIYESLESLTSLLKLRPFHENVESELNSWIDKKIDEGEVVPSYQPVITSSGMRWWRRFFSYSKSSLEL